MGLSRNRQGNYLLLRVGILDAIYSEISGYAPGTKRARFPEVRPFE